MVHETNRPPALLDRVLESIITEINDPRNAVEPPAFRQGLLTARIIVLREFAQAAAKVSKTDAADWRETNPDYYAMIAQEARTARINGESHDACAYAGGTLERFYWMDGYDD